MILWLVGCGLFSKCEPPPCEKEARECEAIGEICWEEGKKLEAEHIFQDACDADPAVCFEIGMFFAGEEKRSKAKHYLLQGCAQDHAESCDYAKRIRL